jgi:retinol dehydrogenase 14
VCDLADCSSVRAAAGALRARHSRLDVLVHNAGATYATRELTRDGIEHTLAVDVVGPLLLTQLLLDRLQASSGRVITLAGIYQRRGKVELADLHFAARPYTAMAANNQAQRGRVLISAELARRAPALCALSVHPGAVLTRAQAELPWYLRLLLHSLLRPGFMRAELGALPVLRLCAAPELRALSGRFFTRFTLAPDLPDAAQCAAFYAACTRLAEQGALP